MATIPILPRGGVPALDLPGIRALGNVGESFNRARDSRNRNELTAERLQDIAEARTQRTAQRDSDATFAQRLSGLDLTTPEGLREAATGGSDPLQLGNRLKFMDILSNQQNTKFNQDRLITSDRRATEDRKRLIDERAAEESALDALLPADTDPELRKALIDSGVAKTIVAEKFAPKEKLTPFQQRTIELKELAETRAQEKQENVQKAETAETTAAKQAAISTANTGKRAIKDALDLLKKDSVFGDAVTGISGFAAGAIPGSDRNAFKGALNTVKGKIAFQALVDLKAQGGTLGALSGTELALLEASEGALDPNLPNDVLQRNLKQIEKIYDKILAAPIAPKSQLKVGDTQDLGGGLSITRTGD